MFLKFVFLAHWVSKYQKWSTLYDKDREAIRLALQKSPQLTAEMMNDFMLTRSDLQLEFVLWLQPSFIQEKSAYSENQFSELMKTVFCVNNAKLASMLWQIHRKCVRQQQALVLFASMMAVCFPFFGNNSNIIASYAAAVISDDLDEQKVETTTFNVAQAHLNKTGLYVSSLFHEKHRAKMAKYGWVCYDDRALVSHLRKNAVRALFSGSNNLDICLEDEAMFHSIRMPLSFTCSPKWCSRMAEIKIQQASSSLCSSLNQVLGMDCTEPATNLEFSSLPSPLKSPPPNLPL